MLAWLKIIILIIKLSFDHYSCTYYIIVGITLLKYWSHYQLRLKRFVLDRNEHRRVLRYWIPIKMRISESGFKLTGEGGETEKLALETHCDFFSIIKLCLNLKPIARPPYQDSWIISGAGHRCFRINKVRSQTRPDDARVSTISVRITLCVKQLDKHHATSIFQFLNMIMVIGVNWI